ncbi:DUF4145 domain-containing protein [Streptomyces sp. NPDC093084]|uniref:DUF4145 domain-containing protein n=1 Tax=Streptomyces sp. NPDC093084 TaxID=3155197 RepID=UPI003412AE52
MTMLHKPVDIVTGGWGGDLVHMVYQCDGCRRLSLATGKRQSLQHGREMRLIVDAAPAWLPLYRDIRSFSDVPEIIGDMATEAHTCRDIGAHRAAVALARAVVEATAKAKGITTGSLEKKIDALFDQRFIREHVRDAAHEVRFGGNEVAHGDLVSEPVDGATATEILGLMDEILEEVFQSPARVARRKQQRLERKQRQTANSDQVDDTTDDDVSIDTPLRSPTEIALDAGGEIVEVQYNEEPPF